MSEEQVEIIEEETAAASTDASIVDINAEQEGTKPEDQAIAGLPAGQAETDYPMESVQESEPVAEVVPEPTQAEKDLAVLVAAYKIKIDPYRFMAVKAIAGAAKI